MNSLTPKEVAELLQITTNTVYEMVKRGELNAYRIGRKMRIDPIEIEKYKSRTSIGLETKQVAEDKKSIDSDSIIICGNDILLDILIKHMESLNLGIPVFRSYLSSYNGLFALYQGEVNIATAHLWDSNTDTYNVEFVEKMLPGTRFVSIHLAKRYQGIYVREGNPYNIKSLDDIKNKDITVILREKGSGSRVLFDQYMSKFNINTWEIRGYDNELKSDIATAGMIARGSADLSVGKELSASQVKGIEFIPLKEEKLELIIKTVDFRKPIYKNIIKILQSREFKEEVKALGKYNIENIGNISFERKR